VDLPLLLETDNAGGQGPRAAPEVVRTMERAQAAARDVMPSAKLEYRSQSAPAVVRRKESTYYTPLLRLRHESLPSRLNKRTNGLHFRSTWHWLSTISQATRVDTGLDLTLTPHKRAHLYRSISLPDIRLRSPKSIDVIEWGDEQPRPKTARHRVGYCALPQLPSSLGDARWCLLQLDRSVLWAFGLKTLSTEADRRAREQSRDSGYRSRGSSMVAQVGEMDLDEDLPDAEKPTAAEAKVTNGVNGTNGSSPHSDPGKFE
jgi:hypothetical protein